MAITTECRGPVSSTSPAVQVAEEKNDAGGKLDLTWSSEKIKRAFSHLLRKV